MNTTLDAALVPSTAPTSTGGPRTRWIGRVLTGLAVLFLSFDVVMKFSHHPSVAEVCEHLGLAASMVPLLGYVLGTCLLLYVIPRTAPIGAVLLTGYLGGAVFTHLRVGDPLATHTLFPVYVGAFLWAGLFLRDERVRRLVAAR